MGNLPSWVFLGLRLWVDWVTVKNVASCDRLRRLGVNVFRPFLDPRTGLNRPTLFQPPPYWLTQAFTGHQKDWARNTMHYLFLWAIGFGAFWLARQLRDEVFLLVTILLGVGCVVWGLASAPLPLQLLIEVGSILALFSVCLGCSGNPD